MDVRGHDGIVARLTRAAAGKLDDQVARPVFRLLARHTEGPAGLLGITGPLGGDGADGGVCEERLQHDVGLDREVGVGERIRRCGRTLGRVLCTAAPDSHDCRRHRRIDHGRPALPLGHPLGQRHRQRRGSVVETASLLRQKPTGGLEPAGCRLTAGDPTDRLRSEEPIVGDVGPVEGECQRTGAGEHPIAIDEEQRLHRRGRGVALGATAVAVGRVEGVAEGVAGVAQHGRVDAATRLRRGHARAACRRIEVA